MITPKLPYTMTRLRRIKLVRPPRAGQFWQGIPHHELVSTIIRKAEALGLSPDNPRIGVSNDEADMVISTSLPGLPRPLNLWNISIGFKTSNAWRTPLRCFHGVESVETEVGIALQEITLTRSKHTINLDIDEVIEDALIQTVKGIPDISYLIGNLQEKPMDEDKLHRLLIQAGRIGIMPWSRLGKIDDLFHECNRQNAWNLLNCFATVVQENPVLIQMEQMVKLRRMLID